MIENYHILLVEDDFELQKLIESLLIKNNYLVTKANSVKEADEFVKIFIFDLILLDIMLPDKTGLEFYKDSIKFRIGSPVIFLSALGNADDRVTGLELGAEDYISKPFDSRELILKIKKNIKIRNNKSNIKFGEKTIFNLKKEVLTHEDKQVNLTSNEVKILKLLIENSHKYLNRELMNKELNLDYFSRSSDMQISRLRMKLKKNCGLKDIIRSVHGKGYKVFY